MLNGGSRTNHPRGRVLVVSNTAWSLYHFRLPLIEALQEEGYEVHGVSPVDAYAGRLVEAGVPHIAVPMNRKGKNPLEDLALAWRLHQLFHHHRPDVVLTYTAKPNIYAPLAARPLEVPVVSTIPGLGSAFAGGGLVPLVTKQLYRYGLRAASTVFFQNPDDLALFVEEGLVDPGLARWIPGTGVDTDRFAPRFVERNGAPFEFLLVSRLLWEKGIGEFVEAARLLRERGVDVRCRLLGFLDPDNPGAIGPETVRRWEAEGVVRYLGGCDGQEVAEHMTRADCVVLPTYYREGIPRTLLEAASLGRPIIAADVAGSREVVDHGANGLLCRPRDPGHLADAMEAMARLDEDERWRMGAAGREKVCRDFDQRRVISEYLELVASLLEPGATTPQVLHPDAR